MHIHGNTSMICKCVTEIGDRVQEYICCVSHTGSFYQVNFTNLVKSKKESFVPLGTNFTTWETAVLVLAAANM